MAIAESSDNVKFGFQQILERVKNHFVIVRQNYACSHKAS